MAKKGKVFIEKSSKKGKGKVYPKDEAKLSVFDTGLQRGFGVFETLRTYNGAPFQVQAHLNRLMDSASGLGINADWNKEDIKKRLEKLLEKSDLKEASIKVILTGGKEKGVMEAENPVLVIAVYPVHNYPDEFYEEGVSVTTFQGRRPLPEIKSLNYLEGYLAVSQARERGAHEAIHCTKSGKIKEGTTSNVFLIREGKLSTPKDGVLPGVTREVVIDLVKEGDFDLEVKEREVDLQEAFRAEEMFLTSTHREVLPVIKINHKDVGPGKVGRRTKKILSQFREKVGKKE